MISIKTRTMSMTLFLGLALVGCGSKDNSLVSVQSAQYQLIENGCDTGVHRFSSKSDYCTGLKDDALNQYCAYDLRVDKYHEDCGTDWPI